MYFMVKNIKMLKILRRHALHSVVNAGRCVRQSRLPHRPARTTLDRACPITILKFNIFNHEVHGPQSTYVNNDCTLNGQIYAWYSVSVTP